MDECWCSKCKWHGAIREAKNKHFGAYCGTGPSDNWGWEEWDDWVCPKCDNTLVIADTEDET